MSKIELGFQIHRALKQALEQQEKVVKHESAAQLLPVIQKLARLNLELEEWYSGKFHLRENDRTNYFLARAEEIEADADRISEEIWKYAPVSLVPIFKRIRAHRDQVTKEESYPKQLRAQYNNFRLTLLEQIAGARFLENNSDLGEEIERILVQYLERRLGSSVRVLRGGHIYDYENNRSDQVDIIITPANAASFCPANTGTGKYNVMIDQVIAAISVTSTLTPNKLQERIEGLRKIPRFQRKDETYVGLKDQPWPLCFIIGAECEDFDALKKRWGEVGKDEEPPEMVFLLDSGYIIKRTFFDPGKTATERVKSVQIQSGDGVFAGLGLGWIEVQIASRNWWMTNQRADWVHGLHKQLRDLEVGESPLYDPKRDPFMMTGVSIHGIIKWGAHGMWAHNRLFLETILVHESNNITEATLLDLKKPWVKTGFFHFEFTPRWFRFGTQHINGDFCALEEWVDPQDAVNHKRHIAVFDSRTGEEVTTRLSKPLSECSDLQALSPVLKGDP